MYWAAYRQNDAFCVVALPNLHGCIAPNTDVEVGAGEDSVKLRVGFDSDYSQNRVYDGPFINIRLVVIGTNEVPINMDDDAVRYSSMALDTKYFGARTHFEALNKNLNALADSARSLANMLPTQMGLKALGGLLMFALFDEKRPTAPPSLDELREALGEIVTNEIARNNASAIAAAWDWLQRWEAKITGLKSKNLVPSAQEVRDFDTELTHALGSGSPALAAMQYFQNSLAARQSVILTYLVGISLFAKLHLLDLGRTAIERDLVLEDYKPLNDFLSAHREALRSSAVQINRDYIDLLQRYGLGPCPEMINIAIGFNLSVVGLGCGGDSPATFLKDQANKIDFQKEAIDKLIAATTGKR